MAFSYWASVFLVGFSILVLRTNSQVCPNSWVHVQGSCYKFSSKALIWNKAKSACEALGSNLLVINSQNELQALTSQTPESHTVWIGLHRDPKDKSRWLWVDGSRPSYTHWRVGEPNGLHEECVEMYPKALALKWNDLSCSYARGYICETRVCPNSWVHMQGSCYKFSSKALYWNEAKSACEALGSDLVVINSQTELQAVTSQIPEGQRTSRWIGLHRAPKDKSRWLWVDGSRPTYTHWNKGEPNSLREECVQMYPKVYGWKWNDHGCSAPCPYICETRKVVNCTVLSVSRLVKTSPDSCLTSQIKFNTTCSFSCPHGYQLEGPSYKQCGANGHWTDSAKSVSCQVVNCSVLSVGRLVKTFPDICVTSQMKLNTTCSFSCPRGYQLQGPYYKQCGANGQWTDSAKSVSCKDVNECTVSNGGCSHKCVNTAGGYKCECPDPELSLASDNKTCHAPGVNVQCNRDNMTIIIPKSLLRGVDREHLRLQDTECKAKETSVDFSLTTPLTGCNTTRRQTASAIVYSNTVLEIPVAAKDVVTRVREIEVQFSCFYSKYGVVSSVGWKPSNRKLVFSDKGKGNFTLSLNMYPDKRFVSSYTKDDFPVAVVLRKRLFFEVLVTSSDKRLSITADRCYATPTQDQKNSLKYEFITKGCPNDNTVRYHATPLVSAQRFSLEAFKFIADHPFVFVHCHVIVCNGTDPGSKCSRKCPSNGRGRREASDHMPDVYSLSQGPLHLAQQRRAEKSANALNKSGSSPILSMALFVMCVACLAATVMMIYLKSRDKPAGYTMLVGGEKE